jgi:hypothetical protein
MSDTKSEIKTYTPWEEHHDTIFVDWADKAACFKWLHNKSYLKYSMKRNMYTIPVIIMSTLTGTANFALERVPDDYKPYCSVAIGSINILAGIITTIAQFLKLNELTESHRVASIAWDKFHRTVRIELIKSPDERVDVAYFMKTTRDEYDRLMETCPPLDKDIISSFKQHLTSSKDKKEMAKKLKIYNNLIKPEIFNEIHSLKEVTYKTKNLSIEEQERSKIEKVLVEKEMYKENLLKVRNFNTQFQLKYSRRPSLEEINTNLKDIDPVELKYIVDDVANEEV